MTPWHSLPSTAQRLIASHCLNLSLGPITKVLTSFFTPDWLIMHNLLLIFPKLRGEVIKLAITEYNDDVAFLKRTNSRSCPYELNRYEWEVLKTNVELEVALLEELLVRELGVQKPKSIGERWTSEYLRWAAGGTLPHWVEAEQKQKNKDEKESGLRIGRQASTQSLITKWASRKGRSVDGGIAW